MILKKILASVTLITMAALYIHAQDTAEEQFLKDSLTAFASEDEDAVPETTQFLHSIKYKVNSLSYETSGRTKPYALERNISTLPESHIFPNEREFTSYLEKIRLQIMNTRMFATVTFVFTTKEENGIALADVVFKTKDSHNVLVLPKPSLDSNSGIEVKFKLKDNNFLGLMNTLNIDFNGRLGNEDTPDDWSKVTFGINFSYDYPFSYWITNDVWSNSFTFDWEIGEDKPEFSVKTGLTIGFPVGQHELDLTFEQGMKRDASYIDFGDELYFTESATLSMPFVLGHIEDTTPVKYTPFVSLSYIWDMDGIDELNTDLIRTPVASIGQTFGFSRINWDKVNNFRNGWYFSTTQQFAVNFHDDTLKERFMPSISGKAKYFLGFKYVGFEAAATFFMYSVICSRLPFPKMPSSSGIDSKRSFAYRSARQPARIIFAFGYAAFIL